MGHATVAVLLVWDLARAAGLDIDRETMWQAILRIARDHDVEAGELLACALAVEARR